MLLRFIFEKHAGPAIFPISLTKIMLNEQTKIEHNFRECMCVFMKNCNEFAHENFLEVLFISVEICTFKKSQDNSCCITVYNMRAEI